MGRRLLQAWPEGQLDGEHPRGNGDMPPPGEKLPDGRWTPGTLLLTPRGELVRVLDFTTEYLNQSRSDAVFTKPLSRPERPWQLWSSTDLFPAPDEPRSAPVNDA